MEKEYVFRKIRKEEIPGMFRLIARRVRWMDEVGIRQWNVTDYLTVYPLSYYEEKHAKGEVYVLAGAASDCVVSAAVLMSGDERWPEDGESAFYLHNFAADPDCKGAGREFLCRAEIYAREQGKRYMRLDSAIDNVPLSRFYETLGYEAVGPCVDGPYEGTLRQKDLTALK